MSELQSILSNKISKKPCDITTYACLQQPQTPDFLKYLKIQQDGSKTSLNFNSEGEEGIKNNRKSKKFIFDGIYDRTQKIKFQFSKIIKSVAQDALKGQNQTFFIYGTEQKCKDKILFGQSQNHGFFLCILSELFDLCHQKALQEEVTIKFSCSLFNKARFVDIFGGNRDCQIQYSKDYVQGGVLHTVPQIIIRNVKTGLKLLNIVLRHIYDLRQEQFTQNLILSLKLQLDCKKQKQWTQVYCISKISFIKLANPSINSSLKGINKNNIWFVNLFNFIQNSNITISTNNHKNTNNNQVQLNSNGSQNIWDQFTQYLIQTFFKSSHKIFGFVSITNKMTSNECLTALLFGNYLRNCKLQSNRYILDLPKIYDQRKIEMNTILELQYIKKSQKQIKNWIQYANLLESYMSQYNYLQFEYSLIIGQACQRLNKYIFTQQLQDFFYAKKINAQTSEDLIDTYTSLKKIRDNIKIVKKKILQDINCNSKQDLSLKNRLQNFFQKQFSLAHHFLIQDTQNIVNKLDIISKKLQETRNQQSFKKQVHLIQKKMNQQKQKQKNKEINKEKAKQREKDNNKQKEKSIEKENMIKNKGAQMQKFEQKQKAPKQNKGGLTQGQKNYNNNGSNLIDNSLQYNLNVNKLNKKSPNSINNLQSMFKNKNVGYCVKKDKISF